MTEWEERYNLIDSMLNKIYPLSDDMDDEKQEQIDTARQLLVIRAGWDKIPIDELRKAANLH